jgi:multiple sugar transport system permease protein
MAGGQAAANRGVPVGRRARKRASAPPGSTARFTPYLFIAPYLVLFVTFVLYPAGSALWVSLHDWDYLLPNKPFVGLENFAELFASGSATSGFFWKSMKATGQFTLYSVPPLVVLPLLVALLLNRRFRGRNFFRAIYFAPYVLGIVVIGILWRYLLDPNIGVINYYLSRIGLPGDIPWTNDLPWAWIALTGMTVWWTLGFNTVIYLAGLQGIDINLYDAAKVDGANTWQVFRHVTLPGLRPVFVFVITITILSSANMFGQAYITTQGGPGNETRTAIMYIFEEGIMNFRMGKAAAMSAILALFLAVVGALNFLFFNRRED